MASTYPWASFESVVWEMGGGTKGDTAWEFFDIPLLTWDSTTNVLMT